MEESQFGIQKYVVLVLCGLAITFISGPGSSSIQTWQIITCNLMINYHEQMKINVYTFIALISGSLLIAIPSDLTSRLKPLVVSLISYGSTTLVLGFCTGYYCFASLSVFRAFWAAALLALTTVYVAELQTPRYRGSSLCFLQIFWLIGVVTMPVLSIAWRTSHFIFGTLALALGILMARYLTESPRLLLSLGKNEAAIAALRKIYERNSRNPEAEYPVKTLTDDGTSLDAQNDMKLRYTHVLKALRPPWYCFLIILQIQFAFNLCYFTMSHWFRRIYYRHVLIFPIIPRDIDCKLGEKYFPAGLLKVEYEKNDSTGSFDSSCGSDHIDPDYYKVVLIVVLTTLPILLWMIFRIDYLGRSYFTTLSHLIAGLLSFCVHFLIGTKHDILYTCSMESMWVVSATASSCLVTEIFKTKTRVLGVGMANSFGYVGMAMGMYGVLLKGDGNCIVVMSLTGILLAGMHIFESCLKKTSYSTLLQSNK